MGDTSDLVERATDGNVKAVRALVERMTPILKARAARALVRHCRGLGRRDVGQEVGDLVQLILSVLFENHGKLIFDWDPTRGRSFNNYIAMVADSRIASLLRTRRGQVWPDEPTETDELDDSAEGHCDAESEVGSREELVLIMARFREAAPERAYELFTLLYLEERSAEEVSALFGLSIENVHTHKSRLGKLARRIASDVLWSDVHPVAPQPPKTADPEDDDG